MQEYFVIIDGQQQGPYSVDALLRLQLPGDVLVWTGGWADWRPLNSVPELQAVQQQAAQPAVQQQAVPQQPAQPQTIVYQQPVVQQQPVQQQPSARPYREEFRPMPATHYAEGLIITIISSLCCLTWVTSAWFIFLLLNFSFLTCCALPCGIVAMQHAKSVSTFYMARQYDEAVRKSKSANRWAKAGWVLIALSVLLTALTYVIILLFFGGTVAALTGSY